VPVPGRLTKTIAAAARFKVTIPDMNWEESFCYFVRLGLLHHDQILLSVTGRFGNGSGAFGWRGEAIGELQRPKPAIR